MGGEPAAEGDRGDERSSGEGAGQLLAVGFAEVRCGVGVEKSEDGGLADPAPAEVEQQVDHSGEVVSRTRLQRSTLTGSENNVSIIVQCTLSYKMCTHLHVDKHTFMQQGL